VPVALAGADAVISAADTRGALLGADVIERRLRSGPLSVIDIAVPRSLDADARALLGASYRSVDDLPGARTRVPDATLAAAFERCELEAVRFCETRAPERAAAIRELRDRAERVRAAKLARAMKHLGHLSTRDRRIVTALTENLVGALLHSPTIALRERPDAAVAARALFDRSPR
jgi:glutamyl-tRNA reductase